MKKNVVSFLIPTINLKGDISKCISSIKNSTYKKVEVIFEQKDGQLVFSVIDEGSGFSFQLPDLKDILLNPNIKNGLSIVQTLCDNIEFNNNGSHITVYFDIAAANELLSRTRISAFTKKTPLAEQKTEEQEDIKNKKKLNE